MAKKKVTRSATRSRNATSDAGGIDLDDAAERLRLARQELQEASEQYAKAKEEATATAHQWNESAVGELLDSGLNFVKKYPAVGIAAATMFGIFLGRLFRR